MCTATRRLAKAIPLLLALCVGMAGCASNFNSIVVPPVGGTFNKTGFPVDVDFDRTEIGPLKGEARSHSLLGLVAWGNSSPTAAAESAGIEQIDQIDAGFFNFLGAYSYYETVVYGTGPDDPELHEHEIGDGERE